VDVVERRHQEVERDVAEPVEGNVDLALQIGVRLVLPDLSGGTAPSTTKSKSFDSILL
jgi:hypothetical protein